MASPPFRTAENPLAPLPGAVAYRCDDCDKDFSEGAVKRLVIQNHQALVCPFCGHGVRKAVEGRVVAPFAPLLMQAFAFPLKEPLAVIALGLTSGLLGYLPFGSWLATAIVVGYLFAIIRKTGAGGERAPEPADFVDLSDLLAPLVRYVLVLVCAAAPAIAADVMQASTPVLVAAAIAGALYLPGAMIAASEATGLLFHPLAPFGIFRRIPGAYLVLVVCLALTAAVGVGASMAGVGLQKALVMIPVLPRLVAATLGLYAPLVAARMLGLLVRENVEEL